MRFSALALSFFLILAAQPAMSQSVLLPDDDNSGSTPVNLGLLPKVAPPTPSPSLPNAPTPPTMPAIPQAGNLQKLMSDPAAMAKMQEAIMNQMGGKLENIKSAADVQAIMNQLTPEQRKMFDTSSYSAITPKGPVAISPGGNVAPESMTEEQLAAQKIFGKNLPQQSSPPSKMMQFAQKIRKSIEDQQKKDVRPPLFLDEIEPTPLDDSAYKAAIDVTVAPTYLWGEEDIQLLERSLGYDAKTIPQNCQVRLDATVNTSNTDAPYAGQIFSGQQKKIKYNGEFQQASFKARAICNPPKELPPNAGIITRSGDKYSILLTGGSSCAPEKKTAYATVGTLTAQYVGNGKVACQFQ
ncbi:MAG: hypothetical protein WC612_02960 [Bdellovibrionales bacterium]